MKIEIQYRWLLLLASAGVLYALRHHRIALSIYVGAVILGVILYAVWLPRRVATAEKRFNRDALKLLTREDLQGLDALARKQWLIRRFGRRHLIPDTLAVAAAATGEHALARGLFLEALRDAPAEERVRIELNLARAEVELGEHDSAEGRLRAVLARRPGLGAAQAALGRVLVLEGEGLEEAAVLLEAAVDTCDPREVKALQVLRAEALARSNQPGWQAALSAGGASEADAERIARLASSHSATRG